MFDLLSDRMVVCSFWIGLTALFLGMALGILTWKLVSFVAAGMVLGAFLGSFTHH